MTSYTHAGVSRLNGEFKVRFANDSTRVKILIKNGHTDIDIIELKYPMSKEDAINYLLEIDFATRDGVTNQEVLAALEAAKDRRAPKPAKAAKAEKPEAPSLESIRARAEVTEDAALEDAPY